MEMIRTILLGLASFITAAAFFLPFWFTLTVQITWDAGKTIQDKTYEIGLYFINTGEILMTSLIQQDKVSNAQVLPGYMRMAQLFYGLGTSGLFVCTASSFLYQCLKYRSVTGTIMLAGFILPSGLCVLLGIVFSLLLSFDETTWHDLPVPDNYMQLEAQPVVSLHYGFYVACVGALIAIVAVIFSWIMALQMCKHIEGVRYQMLTAPLTEHERGINVGGGRYSYASKTGRSYEFEPKGEPGFRYDGYTKPAGEVNF